jgi:hypothetical protein
MDDVQKNAVFLEVKKWEEMLWRKSMQIDKFIEMQWKVKLSRLGKDGENPCNIS